jgi:hypothetical protein
MYIWISTLHTIEEVGSYKAATTRDECVWHL